MLKKLLGAGVLAACCGAAHAAPQHWALAHTSFHDDSAHSFLPADKMNGTFSADMRHHDGLVTAAGLSRLVVAGVDFIACQTQQLMECGVNRFSYAPAGALDLGPRYFANDPLFALDDAIEGAAVATRRNDRQAAVSYSARNERSAGHKGNTAHERSTGIERSERALGWTPATTFLTSAVPQPATYGMLAIGLGLVGVAARRQRRYLRG